MSPPGRPKDEYRSAQHQGTPASRARGTPRRGDRSAVAIESPTTLRRAPCAFAEALA